MSTNLPGNLHAFVATERAREMTSLESDKISLDVAADAIVQSNLAIAFELRTQTLVQVNLHNRRETVRQFRPSFEEVPEDVFEMLENQNMKIDERLGGDL